jgi:hypothetical protein
MQLRKIVENELGIVDKIENEIEKNASPCEKVINPRPVLSH